MNDLNLVLDLRRPSFDPDRDISSSQEGGEEEQENSEEDETDHLSLSVASEFLKGELEEDSVDHLELLKSLESLDINVDPSIQLNSAIRRRSSSNGARGGGSIATKVSLPGAFESPFDDDDDSDSINPNYRASSYSTTSNRDLEVKEVTLLASLIDRILKRLNVKIRRINLRLLLDSESTSSKDDEGENEAIEIRIEEVSFSNEDISAGVEDMVEIGGIPFDRKIVEGIKSFRIRDARVFLKSKIHTPTSPDLNNFNATGRSDRSYSTSSSRSSTSNEREMEQSTTSTLHRNTSPSPSPSLSRSISSSSSSSHIFEPFNDHDYDLSQSISFFPNSQETEEQIEQEEHEESFHSALDSEVCSSSSSSSSSSESEDTNNFLAMSQSIADLRSSTLSISSSTGGRGESEDRSMYASARGSLFSFDQSVVEELREEAVEEQEEEDSPFFDPDSMSRDLRVVEAEENIGVDPMVKQEIDDEETAMEEEAIEDDADDDGFRTIFSLGRDEIVLVLSTVKAQVDTHLDSSTSTSAPITGKKSKPELNLQCKISNPIKVLLLPHQLSTLINLVQISLPSVSSSTETTTSTTAHSSTPTKSKFSLNAAVRIKSITIIQVYELPSSITSSMTKLQAEEFWDSSSSTTTIPFSHLRFKIEDLGLVVSSSPNSQGIEISIPIRTVSLVEGIKLSNESKEAGTVQKIRFLPILIEDRNLILQNNHNHSQSQATSTWGKSIDSTDWTIENKNSEIRGWKLPSLSTRASRKSGAGKVEYVEPALSLGIKDGNSES